jgi:hypothetical protein
MVGDMHAGPDSGHYRDVEIAWTGPCCAARFAAIDVTTNFFSKKVFRVREGFSPNADWASLASICPFKDGDYSTRAF